MRDRYRKIIAGIQIAGGADGVFILVQIIHGEINIVKNDNVVELSLIFTIFAIYLMSLISGILLWRNKRLGYVLSIIVQAFQVPIIVTNSLIYELVSGVRIFYTISRLPNIVKSGVNITFGSTFALFLDNQLNGFVLGINILAILTIIYLVKKLKSFNNNIKEAEIDTVNEVSD